jgi:glycine betaine/proline transport system substrate-binding protein
VCTHEKEGYVFGGRRRGVCVGGLALVAALMLTLAGSALGGRTAASCGDVVLNENSWTGSTSNVYVAKYVLEKRLGCTVKVTTITEGLPSFQAMADGKIDVILEDWDNSLSHPQYLKNGSVRPAGKLGITGVIGWYIPRYVLKQYPAFATWRGLKGKEAVFKSPESGSQGMFLGGDPSYVQKDRALIKGLGLDFKHVVAGAEPAQVARWTQLYKQHKPVIFYWYDPQYLNATYDLVRVKLPSRTKSCRDDEKKGGDPKLYACEYPSYGLDKLISKEFAASGSPAVAFIKKFVWTSDDQNNVSNLIAGKKLKPDKAAEQWVKANPAKVNAWVK